MIAVGLAIAGVMGVLTLAWSIGSSGGSYGNGTPPDDRNRGDLVKIHHVGNFDIEERSYEAGKDSHSSVFCDYWVSINGKPVDFSHFGYLDNYNACGAVVVSETNPPSFVIGIH